MASITSSNKMRATGQLPADAATRLTLLDRARQQGLAQELTDMVAGEVRKREQRRRSLTRGIGVMVLLVGLGLWAVPFYRSTDTISTRSANRQTLALNDGSRADLNARTEIKTDFRYGRRIVRLTAGEAFFAVASDPEHPFLVETPAGTVRVTGTRFNVRVLPGRAAEVTLLEGSVSVQHAGKERMLTPGGQLTFGDGGERQTELGAAELESVVAWREGRLMLDGLTVAEASARMGRYHGKNIEVDPAIGSVRLGGSCPLDDLSAFVQSLKATQVVTVLEGSNGGYRVLRRQP